MPRKTSSAEAGTAYRQTASFRRWQKHGLGQGSLRGEDRARNRRSIQARRWEHPGHLPLAAAQTFSHREPELSLRNGRSNALPDRLCLSPNEDRGENSAPAAEPEARRPRRWAATACLAAGTRFLSLPPSQVPTLWRPCRGSRRAAKYKVLSRSLKCLATALKHAVMQIREDKEFAICSGCSPAKST